MLVLFSSFASSDALMCQNVKASELVFSATDIQLADPSPSSWSRAVATYSSSEFVSDLMIDILCGIVIFHQFFRHQNHYLAAELQFCFQVLIV